jgi:hypothetical protein
VVTVSAAAEEQEAAMRQKRGERAPVKLPKPCVAEEKSRQVRGVDRPKEKSMDGTQKSVRIASGIQQQTPYMCTAEEVGAIEKSYRGLKAALNTSQGSGGQTGLASQV